MTLYPNQFELSVEKGGLDLAFNPSTISCVINSSETATLTAGMAVKIVDSAGGTPKVVKCTADTDEVFGFIVRNLKKSSLVAYDAIEVAMQGNVIYLEAGAAIARGAKVMIDASEATVLTAAGYPSVGYALDKAAADGDLIRVLLYCPVNSYSVSTTTAYSAGAGALPLTHDVIFLTTGGAEALTLADGALGQELKIVMVSDGGDGTLTPAHYLNGTTITFDNYDSVHLVFDGTNWCNVGTPTAAVA